MALFEFPKSKPGDVADTRDGALAETRDYDEAVLGDLGPLDSEAHQEEANAKRDEVARARTVRSTGYWRLPIGILAGFGVAAAAAPAAFVVLGGVTLYSWWEHKSERDADVTRAVRTATRQAKLAELAAAQAPKKPQAPPMPPQGVPPLLAAHVTPASSLTASLTAPSVQVTP